MEKRLIFIHIPKSGGSTFDSVLSRQYKKRSIVSVRDNREAQALLKRKNELQNIRLIKGHMAFGLHTMFKDPTDYISILRHPVERILSNYSFIKERPQHKLHDEIFVKHKMGVAEYVRSGLAHNTENIQTRMFSNAIDIEFGSSDNSMLNTAVYNMDTYFPVVGVTDMYDQFLILAQQHYKWRNIKYARLNTTKSRVRAENIDDETIDVILKYNSLDMELYLLAKNRFKVMWNENLEQNEKLLSSFKASNKRYQKLVNLKRRFIG